MRGLDTRPRVDAAGQPARECKTASLSCIRIGMAEGQLGRLGYSIPPGSTISAEAPILRLRLTELAPQPLPAIVARTGELI
jgi:hypothetical protein